MIVLNKSTQTNCYVNSTKPNLGLNPPFNLCICKTKNLPVLGHFVYMDVVSNMNQTDKQLHACTFIYISLQNI